MKQEDMSDIINKFTSSMNNSESSENSGNSSISPEMISNLMNMFKNNQNKNEKENQPDNSTSSTPQIDIQTLFKMKTIFEQINKKDDPRAQLLMSLKPYLKDSRKDKLDQYVQLLNMSKIIEVFNQSSGGDSQK